MILPDNTPDSPTKSRAGPLSAVSEETHEDYLPPPPAYPEHSSYQYRSVDVEAQAGTSRAPLLQRTGSPPAPHTEEFEPASKRFLKAFGIALLVYIVLVSFTRTVIDGIDWETGRRHVHVSFILSISQPASLFCPREGYGQGMDTTSDIPGLRTVPPVVGSRC